MRLGKYSDGNSYAFSVVMTIYNTENFLVDAIDSIINQSIGFEENIQLILINDGSTDSSEKICLDYQRKFPDNIVYEKKRNGGAASARNAGLKYVIGKYVNFFDSDDIWNLDVYEKVFSFFEQHYDEIDLVACRLRYFEAKEGFLHPLDFKYRGDRIIDLKSEHKSVILSSGNCFFKTDAIKRNRFNESLETYEDACFINELVLLRCKYGVMETAVYHYRKRKDNSSLIDLKTQNKSWYFDILEQFFMNLIHLSQSLYGEVLPYIQFIVMYGLQWRIKKPDTEELSDAECNQYIDLIVKLLGYVDDKIIYEQTNINITQKFYAFQLKYGAGFLERLQLDKKGFVRYKGNKVFNVRAKPRCEIHDIELRDDSIVLKGVTDLTLLGDLFQLELRKSEKICVPVQVIVDKEQQYVGLKGETISKFSHFEVLVPLDEPSCTIQLFIKQGNHAVSLTPEYGVFGKLNMNFENSYCVMKPCIIKLKNGKIRVYRYTKKMHIASEVRYLRELIQQKKYNATLLRLLYFFYKRIVRKPICLIMKPDSMQAHELLHCAKQNKEYDVYICLNEENQSQKSIYNAAKVLKQGSLKHKILFLLTKYAIPVQGEAEIEDLFGEDKDYYKDLYNLNAN